MTPLAAGSDLVVLVTGVIWPLLLGLLLWRLLPVIRNVLQSRGFTVKVAGTEINVQQASDQLARQVDDVRQEVSELKARLAAANGQPASSPADGVHELKRVLWVDDRPENNAYEMAALHRRGVNVVSAHSNAEAGRELDRQRDWDAVITDMGREADSDAGLETIKLVRARGLGDLPVIVYTSAASLARTRDKALACGASGATSSGSELLDILGRLGNAGR
jgi:CheY-like chemotaxis protein